MNTQNMTKLLIAVVLTLTLMVGSSVVANEIGLDVVPAAHACNGGAGGGC